MPPITTPLSLYEGWKLMDLYAKRPFNVWEDHIMTSRFVDGLPVVNVHCSNSNHSLGDKFILGDHQVANTPWHGFYKFEKSFFFHT
ncbi:hypothetical protein ES332_A07G099300v1 [Gossypium tomentosum]|uniref:Uncharacterized protein n=1 Tax=Gossypium tomentosum TaxID=34277 RepID=A0A5D2PTU4_GOSTO|nr:hypothetical protein ES332_A07G099300v1 [Gossypium tomentosum]